MTDESTIEPTSLEIIAQRHDVPSGWMGPGLYSFGFRLSITPPARAALIDRRTGQELGITTETLTGECGAGGMWKCDTLEDFQAVELKVTRMEESAG